MRSFHFILLFISLITVAPFATIAQTANTKVTLSGYVRDVTNGETLVGANVYNAANRQQGAATNVYGFYSITIPTGQYTFECSYIGYLTQQITLNLTADQTLNIDLPSTSIMKNEVVVTSKRADENVQSTDMGKQELSIEKIKSLPALLGEVDVVRTLQLLPGVSSSGDLNAGFYVRGGGPDQNLVLLDEAVVYNTGHLLGFFSVFNPDAIKNTTLHKGSMPAEYGGRLSSVVDVTMKEGNNKKYQFDGGVGTLSSRLTVQGPIQKEKSSFLVTGRRTYVDLLAKPFIKNTEFAGTGYYFYDLNAKVNYRFSDKDRLYLSGYFGRDVFNYSSTDGFSFRMPWGNTTTTLRWTHTLNKKTFINTSAIYNDYYFGANSSFDEFNSEFHTNIRDWNAKIDLDHFPSVLHKIKSGINYTWHRFTPYSVNATVGETVFQTDSLNKQYAHEIAAYAQDDWAISEKFKIAYGVRTTFYQQVGPYRRIEFGNQNTIIDTLNYKKGEPIVKYWGFEPRVSMRVGLGKNNSIKASWVLTNQFIHLVSNSGSTLPTDLWVPSTKRIKPQRGSQYALGYFHNFNDNTYELSTELYYRDLKNQIEYSDSYVPSLGRELEDEFVFGRGRAYGVEVFFKKAKGRFNGWLGYTFSRTERQFASLNQNEWFPTRYDRTHDVELVASFEASKKWTISATWVYNTGQALTLPNGFFIFDGWLHTSYDMPRNSYRLKPYHRLDIAAVLILTDKPKFYNDLTFSIYNVYSRMNPFFVYASPEFPKNENGGGNSNGGLITQPINIKLKQVSLFPILPAITWNFRF